MTSQEPQPEGPAIRRTTFFSGNVQGVGFRYTTCQLAKKYKITGTVCNLLDGRVEVVTEGLPSEVDQFVVELEQTMTRHVEHSTCTDSTARADFDAFLIKY